MKLFAKVNDSQLFLRALNENGTSFYRCDGPNIEAVYFSSNRTLYFYGEMSLAQFETLKAQAYEVQRIELDEFRGQVEINQFKE